MARSRVFAVRMMPSGVRQLPRSIPHRSGATAVRLSLGRVGVLTPDEGRRGWRGDALDRVAAMGEGPLGRAPRGPAWSDGGANWLDHDLRRRPRRRSRTKRRRVEKPTVPVLSGMSCRCLGKRTDRVVAGTGLMSRSFRPTSPPAEKSRRCQDEASRTRGSSPAVADYGSALVGRCSAAMLQFAVARRLLGAKNPQKAVPLSEGRLSVSGSCPEIVVGSAWPMYWRQWKASTRAARRGRRRRCGCCC